MTDDDVTRFDPVRLPPSPKELMDFDCLAFTEQRIGESVYIEPPSDWTVYGPEGDLFDYPIQVTVLGIEGDRAKLGVHRYISLRLLQGPPPNKEWREVWQKGMEYPEGALPALHAGKVANGFSILGNTLYIDDVRAFDQYLGVPDELLNEYEEGKREVWEMYTCGPHPDFSYVVMAGNDIPELTVATAEFEMWFTKRRYVVSVVSNIPTICQKPHSVALAEQYLPRYAGNLKELMKTYHIAQIEPTFRWIDME